MIRLVLHNRVENITKENLMWIFSKRKGEEGFNPLSANPTKWSNTLKQFVGLWVLRLKVLTSYQDLKTEFLDNLFSSLKQLTISYL